MRINFLVAVAVLVALGLSLRELATYDQIKGKTAEILSEQES